MENQNNQDVVVLSSDEDEDGNQNESDTELEYVPISAETKQKLFELFEGAATFDDADVHQFNRAWAEPSGHILQNIFLPAR